ncbi:MAG: SDR family oxidoreductase [Byssovorax sp.]
MKKTVLITGCSTGIGAAAARVFAENGWNVAATMRNPAHGEALKALPGVEVLALDVIDEASVNAAVRRTIEAFGAVDVLVNNAGYGTFGPFETASHEIIARQFDTNVHGVFNTTRAVLPSMRERKSGVIINVSSVGGLTAFPLFSLYHATKFALVGFSESLGFELAPFGIQVKMVAPGGVKTDFGGRSLVRTFEGDGGAYAGSIAQVADAFTSGGAGYSSSESLGKAIFGAATDGSKQTRYIVGDDATAMLAGRAQMTDEQYVAMMTEQFGLGVK